MSFYLNWIGDVSPLNLDDCLVCLPQLVLKLALTRLSVGVSADAAGAGTLVIKSSDQVLVELI